MTETINTNDTDEPDWEFLKIATAVMCGVGFGVTIVPLRRIAKANGFPVWEPFGLPSAELWISSGVMTLLVSFVMLMLAIRASE